MNINEHTTPSITQEFIRLNNDVTIEKTFYDLIRSQVRYRLPSLSHDRVYDSDSLLGEAFEKMLDNVDCTFAQMCIWHMAKRNRLPLIAISRGHYKPRVFILK